MLCCYICFTSGGQLQVHVSDRVSTMLRPGRYPSDCFLVVPSTLRNANTNIQPKQCCY